jgi:hemoglobin
MSEMTLYEAVGGMPFFDELIERFYDGVAGDEVLIAMYPEDLTDAKRHLALFIAQYFGGPSEYHEVRGAPMLRRRHLPFPIDDDAAKRWVDHMRAALAQMDVPEDARAEMDAYFEYSAFALRNRE